MTAGRSIEDYCFPTHCSRGERRQLLTLGKTGTAVDHGSKWMDIFYAANITCFIVLEQLGEDLPGKLYFIDELSHESEDRSVVMDSPPLSLIKIGVARDWPDARALWLVRVHNL